MNPQTKKRTLAIVSNRLPVSLQVNSRGWKTRRSSGGLASVLSSLMAQDGVVWVGWPGCDVPRRFRGDVIEDLALDKLCPVFLSRTEEEHFYHGIGNQVLWPLFHYFADKVHFREEAWQQYVHVNRKFADEVLRVIGDAPARVWVHDFHLTLVPRMLREANPDLEIGFFLHIPFPSSELYRLLPSREEILLGLLGADYIGFHTHDYLRHFRASGMSVLGIDSEHDEIQFEGRRIGLGVHPIGIETARFEQVLEKPETVELIRELRERYGGRKIILGVERLDYTKGVMLKLEAFERFLEWHPELGKDVTLLQVLVPSRLDHPDYQELKAEIEQYVGRINGRYGGPGRTPVEYMHRGVNLDQLVALYRLADVCMVTSIRDGMNLVAQEFVLCQGASPGAEDAFRGVLVLSEFAGVAQSLSRAMLINPWDIRETVDALVTALQMPSDERRERTEEMLEVVRAMESSRWADRFLDRLSLASIRSRRMRQSRTLAGKLEDAVRKRFERAPAREIFLDYDGTLREVERTPEEATPTPKILAILERLASFPGSRVHLVSGRHRQTLESWFGQLPIHLVAEHGFSWRGPNEMNWHEMQDVDLEWIPAVRELLIDVAREVPGTRLERKPCGLAWHYRMADFDYSLWRAQQLERQLEQDFADLPIDIVHGQRVIEVRAAGINKGTYVKRILAEAADGTFALCIGDDQTDEDMYRVLPDDAVGVHVGGGTAATRFTIATPMRVRAFLERLFDQPEHADSRS